MVMKTSTEPWHGAREKNPALIQLFIETFSPPGGCILDLTMNLCMEFLIVFN
jgi:hypothetical protein